MMTQQPYSLICDSLDEIDVLLGNLKTLWRSCRYQEMEYLDDEGHETSATDLGMGGHSTVLEQSIRTLSRARQNLQQAKQSLRPNQQEGQP